MKHTKKEFSFDGFFIDPVAFRKPKKKIQRKKPSKKDIADTMSALENSDKDLWSDLGVALQYHYAPAGVHFKAPYRKMGKKLWNALQIRLYDFLCCAKEGNPKEGQPREWAREAVGGESRAIVVAVLTGLAGRLSLPMSMAIPAAALVLKHGLVSFCRLGRPSPTSATVGQILADKEAEMKRLRERLSPPTRKTP